MKTLIIGIIAALTSSLLIAKSPVLSAKQLSSPPSKVIRVCCAFGSDLSVGHIPFVKKTDITSIQELGTHQYLGGHTEGNGIIYTKSGGFIDLGHLRDCADWTAYLYTLISSKSSSDEGITLNLGIEGGIKTLKIDSGLNDVDLYELAGRIAYDISVWHEIGTWFGTSYIPAVPERFSSFSPEDLYSNLLGTKIGILALKSGLSYEEAMTQLIVSTMDNLDAVSTSEETYFAMENVEDMWWTRKRALPNKKLLLKRYLDNDYFLTPWVLPEGDEAQFLNKLDKPDESLRTLYQLSVKLNYKFHLKSILPDKLNRTIDQNDFDELIHYIKQDIGRDDLKTAKRMEKINSKKRKKPYHTG
jgi:hypothetical protein